MSRSAQTYDGAADRFPLWTMHGRGGRVIMPSLLWVNNTTTTHFIENTTHLIQDIALRAGYEPRRIPPGPRYFVSALCYDTARYIPLCIVCVLQYCKPHYKRRENSLAMQRFLWKILSIQDYNRSPWVQRASCGAEEHKLQWDGAESERWWGGSRLKGSSSKIATLGSHLLLHRA